jgi:hypothetical protein
MRWIVLAALLASTPVEAHCFARWHYPWSQRCGGARQGQVRINSDKLRQFVPPGRGPSGPAAIPLPSLARADFDGGAADEPIRARVLLRAALEAANGH